MATISDMSLTSSLLCLVLLGSAQGDDGCGYTEWKCGKGCIGYGEKCVCGNTTLAISSSSWCCDPTCSGPPALQAQCYPLPSHAMGSATTTLRIETGTIME